MRRTDRQQKLNELKDLMAGRKSLSDVLRPIDGMLFINDGKVFCHTSKAGTIHFKEGEEPDVETYKKQIGKGAGELEVKFEDYSKPDQP